MPGLPYGAESHHFPFIAIGLKAEELRKLAIKISNRVRERNREYVFEPPVAPMPDGRRFPSAPAIHYHNGGLIQARVSVRADGVREMMIHESHPRLRWAELLREHLRSASLMPHREKV